MIKRLILILGLTMACAGLSHAQYAFPSEITSKGGRILVDGEKLTAQQAAQLFSEFGGEQMGEQYLANRKGYRTGMTLISVGVPMVAVGYFTSIVGALLTLDSEVAQSGEAMYYTGAAMSITGALMTVAGIPTTIVFKKRIKNTAAEYNASVASRQTLALSPARSGIGIAMTF